MMMQAAKLFGANDIRVVTCPVPEIGDDEMLLKTGAASICGSDLRMIANGYRGVDAEHPLTLGHEFSGTIVAVGKNVSTYKVGMRVAVAPNMGCGVCDRCIEGDTHLCPDYQAFGIHLDGGFAEYVRIVGAAIRQGNVMILDDDVPLDQASAIEPFSCVLNGQERIGIHPDDSVLIIGAGPIGIMHAMLAKLQGASHVYMYDLSADRLTLCAEVDPWLESIVGDDLQGELLKRTSGRGVDVCITACPSGAAQAQALALMAMNGRILYFGGLPANHDEVALHTNLIHYKQLLICGSTRANVRHYREIARLLAADRLSLDGILSAHYPLERFAEAVDFSRSGKGLKTVISF